MICSILRCYIKNFEKISPKLFSRNLFNEDIYNAKSKDIPKFDILCAGFPCQPFSQIGYKKGFKEGQEKAKTQNTSSKQTTSSNKSSGTSKKGGFKGSGTSSGAFK